MTTSTSDDDFKYEDWPLLIVSIILFYFGRKLFQRWLESIAKDVKVRSGKETVWVESVYKLSYYVWIWPIGVVVGWDYFHFPLQCFEQWQLEGQHDSTMFRFFAYTQLGFYIASLIQHVDGTESRRSDWLQMLIHHVATVILIGGSMYMQLFRIGVVVLILHDVCDITLEAAKALTYMDSNINIIFWFSTVIIWQITRIYLYLDRVLLPIYYGIPGLVLENKAHPSINQVRLYFLFFLGTIFLLNVMWGYMLVTGAFSVLFRGMKAEDPREEPSEKSEQQTDANNGDQSQKDGQQNEEQVQKKEQKQKVH